MPLIDQSVYFFSAFWTLQLFLTWLNQSLKSLLCCIDSVVLQHEVCQIWNFQKPVLILSSV